MSRSSDHHPSSSDEPTSGSPSIGAPSGQARGAEPEPATPEGSQKSKEPQVHIVTTRCRCQRIVGHVELSGPWAQLPAFCCHCNSCRRATGALYSCVALCKAGWFEIDQSLFKLYALSANKTLLFCPVCGTPMFFLYSKRGGHVVTEKQVFTGTLSVDPDIALFRIMNHINVGDTIDGGASVWMIHPNADGTPARRWLQRAARSKELPVDWPATLQTTPAATTTEATIDDTKTMAAGNRTARAATDRKIQEGIPMRCHCGGFSILFQPDLAPIDGRFVDPSSKQVLAALDGCNNSRLTSGVDIFPWIYTPRSFVEFDTERPGGDLDYLVEWKVLTKYPRKGKNDAACYFCSVCSATVAYTDSTEPSMIALAAGLLVSDTGARAEDVLVWDLKLPIAYKEDGIGSWRERMVQRIENVAGSYMDSRGIDLSERRAEWLKLWKDTRSPDDPSPSPRTRLG